MISKILLPIDGSERSREAVRYAISLAKQTKSLHLFNVVEAQVASLSSENDINSFLNAEVDYLLEMEMAIKEQGILIVRQGVKIH